MINVNLIEKIINRKFYNLNKREKKLARNILIKKEKMNVKNIPEEIKTQIIIYRKKQKKKTILSRNLILNKLSKNIAINVIHLYSYFFIRKINRKHIIS